MFSPDEVEKLAERLHDAWARKKLQQGWKYGPVKDEALKTHPDLVPYEDLPEEKKELDRMFIRNFERILQKAGFEVVKGHGGYSLTEEDIERLAEESHNLWLEKADPSHPYCRPYRELPEEAKELNRNTVRELLQILKEQGYGVKRLP